MLAQNFKIGYVCFAHRSVQRVINLKPLILIDCDQKYLSLRQMYVCLCVCACAVCYCHSNYLVEIKKNKEVITHSGEGFEALWWAGVKVKVVKEVSVVGRLIRGMCPAH